MFSVPTPPEIAPRITVPDPPPTLTTPPLLIVSVPGAVATHLHEVRRGAAGAVDGDRAGAVGIIANDETKAGDGAAVVMASVPVPALPTAKAPDRLMELPAPSTVTVPRLSTMFPMVPRSR